MIFVVSEDCALTAIVDCRSCMQRDAPQVSLLSLCILENSARDQEDL